jgi:hypothetical protein
MEFGTEWRLGNDMHGYETETHIGRYMVEING